jgi:YHS domain-containing protein
MTLSTVVKDPVCGAETEPKATTAHIEHDGHTHYFCGSKCKEHFEQNPDVYAAKCHEAKASESNESLQNDKVSVF